MGGVYTHMVGGFHGFEGFPEILCVSKKLRRRRRREGGQPLLPPRSDQEEGSGRGGGVRPPPPSNPRFTHNFDPPNRGGPLFRRFFCCGNKKAKQGACPLWDRRTGGQAGVTHNSASGHHKTSGYYWGRWGSRALLAPVYNL